MTGSLAVLAEEDGTSRLQSSLDIEAPNRLAENESPEVIFLLTAYLPSEATAPPNPVPPGQAVVEQTPSPSPTPLSIGGPNWDRLKSVLRIADSTNPLDIGLFEQGTPLRIQLNTIDDAVLRPVPSPIADATPVTISGISAATPGPDIANIQPTEHVAGDAGSEAASPAPGDTSPPNATPLKETVAVRDLTDSIVDGILGPPVIYSSKDRVFVHVAQAEQPLEGPGTQFGGWIIKPRDGSLHLSIRTKPANMVWNVELCVDGYQIVSADPPPSSMDLSHLRWSFPSHPFGPVHEVNVVAEPKRATWFRQWINSDARATMVLGWGLFVPAALLVLGLWSSRLSGSVAFEVREAQTRLLSMSFAVVTLAAAGVMMLLIRALFLTPAGQQNRNEQWEIPVFVVSALIICIGLIGVSHWRDLKPPQIVSQVLLPLAFIACVFGLIVFARYATGFPGWRPIWQPLQRSLLVVGYFAFFAAAIRLWDGPAAPFPIRHKDRYLVAMGAIGLLLCAHSVYDMRTLVTTNFPSSLDDVVAVVAPIWVTICVIVGSVLLALALLPKQISGLRITGAGRIHAILAIAIVLSAIFVRWVSTLYSRQTFPDRALVATDPILLLPDVYSRRMQDDFVGYLESFLVPTLNLLPLLGLTGLAGMLAAGATINPDQDAQIDRSWIERIVKFMFAAFVVGYGGVVVGLRAPIAFFAGLILLPLALEVRSDIFPRSADNHGKPFFARFLAGFRNALRTLFIAPARPEPAPDEAADASASVPVEDWWIQGAHATKLGFLLALAPVSFFIYVFLTDPVSGALSSNSPFAMAVFVTNVAYEIAFWLVAAFAFGFLFPCLKGGTGLTKGIALASVYIGANAIAAFIGAPGDALWQVRSFQLFLFLILLGIWIDLGIQHPAGMVKHYELGDPADWVKRILPLASALAMVALQIFQGNTETAIRSLITGQNQNEILTFACWAAGIPTC